MPIVDWLKIEASAPAKIILSGEYSVVYDKQAVAAAIDLRTRVTIRPNNKDGTVRLNLKNLNNIREWPITSLSACRIVSKYNECLEYQEEMPAKLFHLLHTRYCKQSVDNQTTPPSATATTPSAPTVTPLPTSPSTTTMTATSTTTTTTTTSTTVAATTNPSGDNTSGTKIFDKSTDDAVIAFLLLYIGLSDSYASSARPALDIEVDSEVPVGSGLGSSSAYSVALCGALMRVFRVAAEKHVISSWAFNIDKYFHGKPSGVDNNVITHGGYILFQSGKFKTSSVTHKASIRAMIIDTGVSRSTKKLSEKVFKQKLEDPVKMNGIFDSINDCTTQIWRNLNEPEFSLGYISEILHANQLLLNCIQVGHPVLTDICSRAQEHNLTAKQTGAGGGGVAFVLYEDSNNCQHVDRLRAELRDAGFTVSDHPIGCEGITVKITPDPAFNFG